MKTLASLVTVLVIAVAAVAAVAVAAGDGPGSLPVGMSPPGGEAPTSTANVTDQQALDTDARQYAEDFGVLLAEARARLLGQKSLGGALDRLEQQFPARFAGGWIEHRPEFRAVARFKGAVPPGAGDVAGANVVLRSGAARSLVELRSQADQVYDDVADVFDATVVTGSDVKTGAVEVSIEIPAADAGASEAELRARLPLSARAANVRVGFLDGPVIDMQHTYGGALTSGCTTGFSVFRVSDHTEGILTAGHCSNDLTYFPADGSASYDMDWIDGHRGDYGDVQWHTTPTHDDVAEFYSGPTHLRHVHGTFGTFHNGDYLCKYGRYGGYDCSTVHDTSVSGTDEDGFHLERMVELDDNVSVDGDSGGPWFLGNEAAGTTIGASISAWGTVRSVFSPIGYADNALPGIGLLVIIH